MMNSKHFILTIIFSLIIYSNPTAVNNSDNPKNKVKILSYNLRFGELASLEELAEFIKNEDPDVVALQEVDVRTYRDRAPKQNGKDFISELAYHTGMLGVYGKTIPYMGGYYGIGILSKYPMASVERIYLPKTEHGKEQRAVLVADVEYKEGEYFTFASTHLDYTNTQERQIQVEKLNEILLNKTYPVIVAGDFNGRPDAIEIINGMAQWKQVCNSDATVPATNPKSKIDYIFVYPKDKWEVIENTSYFIQLSDHLPISAVVEIR